MLPIAGISYEIIRLAGKRGGKGFWGALLWPGLQMQLLTTREPDDAQIETALAALKAALESGESEGSQPAHALAWGAASPLAFPFWPLNP